MYQSTVVYSGHSLLGFNSEFAIISIELSMWVLNFVLQAEESLMRATIHVLYDVYYYHLTAVESGRWSQPCLREVPYYSTATFGQAYWGPTCNLL